jgi:uncharacterized protein YceH (UPF0502 family)
MKHATGSKAFPLSMNQILNAIVRAALRDPVFLTKCLSEASVRAAFDARADR